jgi:hypothetical protein
MTPNQRQKPSSASAADNLWQKIKSLARAIRSFAKYGDVALNVHDHRMMICMDCPYRRFTANGIFCGACGCLPSPLSDLRTKCRLPDADCPEGNWDE